MSSAGKGKLVLTDGKLSAKSDKGGQMTLQLFADSGSSERMLRAKLKTAKGSTIGPILNESRSRFLLVAQSDP